MELDVKEWLRITLAFGMTDIKKWNYIDINHAYESYSIVTSDKTLQNDRYIRAMRSLSDKQLDGILSVCDKNGIFIVTPDDIDYPTGFRYLANPPSVLFVMGNTDVLSEMPSAAVLGARDCCEYSARTAYRFSYELASAGINVVSGLARGVDSSAHTAALEAGGITTAVLGSGILCDYPAGTRSLKRQIAVKGAVISEYLPTAKPAKHTFKVRNRLVTALCECALIVEASERSGCLNSAAHAAEQGKELFVLPPRDVFSERFAGQCGLIRDGADIAFSPADIIHFIRDLNRF